MTLFLIIIFQIVLRHGAWEQKRQAKGNTAVDTIINYINQPLPPVSELPKFWTSADNEIALQQIFIDWIQEKYNDDKPLYLGGCHRNNQLNHSYKIFSGKMKVVTVLYCDTRRQMTDFRTI